MTQILNYVPVLFAILCYALAGTFRADVGVHDGLLMLAGVLAGAAIPRLGDSLSTRKSEDKQAGHATPSILFTLLFAALATLVAASFFPRRANADSNDPATGGCIAYNNDAVLTGPTARPQTCKVSYQMSMLAAFTAVNFKTGDLVFGANAVALGPCYGITYQPGQWYGSGADVCFTIREATGQPNQYTGALMLHTVRFGAIGVGAQGTQNSGAPGVYWQALGFMALKLPVL
jgi:hypothetical protein